MASRPSITPEQSARERSVAFGLALDSTIASAYLIVAILGGSLTLLAELIRMVLMSVIEIFALALMRRLHRGRLVGMEFGSGKLEQAANLMIAGGMMGAALWIVLGAVKLIGGERAVGTPFGLALAAILGAVNVYINFLAWDAVRKATLSGGSLIMQGQLKARAVRLFSSMFALTTMTVAALSTDEVIVAWADATGALFVACFTMINALKMLRAGIPDILDRSAGKEVKAAINRALARHVGEYGCFHRMRSRRSGGVVFIELALGFDPGLSLAEVVSRTDGLKETLLGEIDHADISILVSSHN